MKEISSERWRELVRTGTEHLINVAAERGSIDYSTFNGHVCGGLFNLADVSERDQLGELLGDISRASVREHDVMLSALVHHKGRPMDVGTGFYGLAIEIGRLDPKANKDMRYIFLGHE